MIIAVYADDSADAGRRHVFTVGGFMGLPEWFFEAERKWEKILKDNNLQYFKASEARMITGQFDPTRLLMLPSACHTFADIVRHKLGKIIWQEHLGGISVSLHMEEFNKVLREHADAAECFGGANPYIFMFKRFIVESIHQLKIDWPRGIGIPLAFVFDDHSDWRAAEEAYAVLKLDPYLTHSIATISHADDKRVPALQMADLAAYESRYRVMTELGLEPIREEWTRMDDNHAFYSGLLVREEHVLEILERYRSDKSQQ